MSIELTIGLCVAFSSLSLIIGFLLGSLYMLGALEESGRIEISGKV